MKAFIYFLKILKHLVKNLYYSVFKISYSIETINDLSVKSWIQCLSYSESSILKDFYLFQTNIFWRTKSNFRIFSLISLYTWPDSIDSIDS